MLRDRRILGAVIAGGEARRFGGDKATTPIAGRPMLAHVLDALRPQVAALVICGRTWPGEACLPDLRPGRIGPLAGLEAALDHAARMNFDAVVSAPVDTLPLPDDLVDHLSGDGASVLVSQHLIGYWPVGCQTLLQSYIDAGGRSVTGWVRKANARSVTSPLVMTNINTPADLALFDNDVVWSG